MKGGYHVSYYYNALTLRTTAIYDSTSAANQVGSYSSNSDVSVETCGSQRFFKTNLGYILAKQVYIPNGSSSAVIQGDSTDDYSNLREIPDSSSSRLAKLYPGEEVTVLDETSNNYSRVSTTFGTGWVLSSSLYYG